MVQAGDLFDELVWRLTPTERELDIARQHRDEVIRRVRIPGFVGWENSGSYIKRTCIRPFEDLDIIVGIDSNEYDSDPERIITRLHYQLRNSFPKSTVRLQTHSVGVVFAGGFRVDAVPGLAHKQKSGYWRIKDRDDGRWVSTNIALHKQFFEARQAADGRFRDIVKIAKHWKSARRRKYSSFMIELMVAKAFEGGIPRGKDVAIHEFFEWMSTDAFEGPIVFGDYYDPSKVKPAADALVVLDPTNSLNNVSRSLDRAAVEELQSAADYARARSQTALDENSRGATAAVWRELLPAFPPPY